MRWPFLKIFVGRICRGLQHLHLPEHSIYDISLEGKKSTRRWFE